jgi:hypothetical protein
MRKDGIFHVRASAASGSVFLIAGNRKGIAVKGVLIERCNRKAVFYRDAHIAVEYDIPPQQDGGSLTNRNGLVAAVVDDILFDEQIPRTLSDINAVAVRSGKIIDPVLPYNTAGDSVVIDAVGIG